MFNRTAAVNYAGKYAFNYNPAYYDFTELGGDCTNFVSQCLFAGGIKMDYAPLGWYYVSLNSRAPAWTGVNEFYSYGIKEKQTGFTLKPCLPEDLNIADVIQLGNGDRYYHTLLVSKIIKENETVRIFVAAHDYDAFNVPLSDYAYQTARYLKITE